MWFRSKAPSTNPHTAPQLPAAPDQPADAAADQAQPLPRGVAVLLGAAGAVITVAGLRSASGIVGPGFLALVLAITVSPIQAWLRRHHIPTWLALLLTMLVTYGSLLALAGALWVSVAQLATLLPQYQAKFTDLVDQISTWLQQLGVTQSQITSALGKLDPGSIVGALQGVLTGTAGVLAALVLLVALLFFLIIESASYPRRFALAQAQRPDVADALLGFVHFVRQYMLVSTVFGLIVALIDVAALYWLGVPLPWLWGLLAFITNYVPNIGFVVGLAPPALLALLGSGVRQAVLVVVAYSVVNVVIQSLIQPRFVGSAVGLSATLTFLSLIVWSFVIGPLGALLAVPLSLLMKALLVDADPGSRWLTPLIGTDSSSAKNGQSAEALERSGLRGEHHTSGRRLR
jgi:AI-2 transport protein TqsA